MTVPKRRTRQRCKHYEATHGFCTAPNTRFVRDKNTIWHWCLYCEGTKGCEQFQFNAEVDK